MYISYGKNNNIGRCVWRTGRESGNGNEAIDGVRSRIDAPVSDLRPAVWFLMNWPMCLRIN